MKFAGSRLALVATIIATGGVNCARAQDSGSVPAHELQAKLQYCKGCHGSLGQGYRGYSPIPRLAGQQPEYFENQLKAFIERRRLNPIMFNVAHVMSPAMVSGLATHFRDLNPQPVGGGSRNLVPEGKKIYEDGVPGSEVPPCASCHGPQAKGEGQFPRLAGQLPEYVLRKLTNWTSERGQDPSKPDSSALMLPIAHGLTEAQIKAVAAYVSSLE